ncbi:PREDICTED: membrane-associated progesterone receptor component 1-like [Dufourea novaeangliae]|uniref:Membrane-associated progesterone receptor component 2 n=1 Tax=Dufourea novaeangliae TaxID=178035 RepID=A0A154PIQ9_DUFNO|nr:PREDICTED: membrane-associated progesterone receptor component 1-like [Dufourea novaeangliae]KZC11739.1 Membrane-associated progesterone receptor component 2 [Dufourea novaeangliae]
MAEKNDSPGSTSTSGQESQQLILTFIGEIVKSPINLILVGVIALLVYKIVKSKTKTEIPMQEVKVLPKLRRDFTLQELKEYNGRGPDERILVAVNGSIYDCTRGAKFYGPGGPYEAFGGRDASRGLATFSVESIRDEYDDLSDLNTTEMNSVREWEEQFKEKYDYVGKLLKPGEAPTNYSDEEDEGSQQETESKLEQQESETKSDCEGSKAKSKND